jgi:hypothetical protein
MTHSYKLFKLFKGNDISTVVTNIETLLIKSGLIYKIAYDPSVKKWYIVIG